MHANTQRNRRARKSKVPRAISAPPDFQLTRLRYVDNILLTPTALSPLQSWVFRINDLYDPNYSGSGHQSYFRDQMFTLYQYARVLSASIRVTCVTDSAQVPLMLVLAPLQSVTGTPDTLVTTASERKGSQTCYINGQSIRNMSASTTCDKFFGQAPGSTLGDTVYLQNASTVLLGSNCMWYEMLAYGLTSNTQNVYVKVEIEQIARFEQPVQQAGS